MRLGSLNFFPHPQLGEEYRQKQVHECGKRVGVLQIVLVLGNKFVNDDQGHTYELARLFPFAGLSGFHWGLYHNTNRPTNAPLQADPQGPTAR